MEVPIMKKIISILLTAVLLLSFVSCEKNGEGKSAERENMTKCTVKVDPEVSSKKVSVSLWYPTDAGIEMAEGEEESMIFFTDMEDDYEIIFELFADNTFADIRDYASIYEQMTIGGREGYLYDEGDILIYYIYLGSTGEEDVYFEADLYSLFDESTDLRAVFASEEVQAILNSIEYKGSK